MNEVSWSVAELEQLFGAPDFSAADAGKPLSVQSIGGVAVDSRLVKPGDLFVALAGDPGERFNPSARSSADGHDYLAHALERGAAAALVSRRQRVAIPQYQTPETYEGLWQLGHAARARLAGPVIAITGSSGKTTAKNFLAQSMGAYAPPGSFNNHIGVPLSLANAWNAAPAWVFEVGTSFPGEIAPLTAMVQPDLAILLNVHNAHIENFPSRQALIEEKSQIFSTVGARGLRVVHDELALPGFGFGWLPDSQARILDIQGETLSLSLFGEKLVARIPGGGVHRGLTLSACLLAMKLLDMDLQSGLALDTDAVPAGRGNRHVSAGIEVVDDSYNANPASMNAAISAFLAGPEAEGAIQPRAQGRNLVILGDMRELGAESDQAHANILSRLAHEPTVHGIVLVGEQMAKALAGLRGGPEEGLLASRLLGCFDQCGSALMQQVTQTLETGDRVLVKGSNRVFWAHGFVDNLLEQLQ